MTPRELILIFFFTTTALGFLYFSIISWREKHQRAALIGALLTFLPLILILISLISPPWLQTSLLIVIIIVLVATIFLLTRPFTDRPTPSPPPDARVDERTIMFARARLQPGTPNYEAYYSNHPEHIQLDMVFRKNPGLLAPGAAF